MAPYDAEDTPLVLPLQVLPRTGFPPLAKLHGNEEVGSVCVCAGEGQTSDSKATHTGLFNPILPL